MRRLVVGAALVVLGLALWAPDFLASSVSLGGPFVPFGTSTARLMTPIGVVGLVLAAAALVLVVRHAWPVLRRADPIGAGLLGRALGCIVF